MATKWFFSSILTNLLVDSPWYTEASPYTHVFTYVLRYGFLFISSIIHFILISNSSRHVKLELHKADSCVLLTCPHRLFEHLLASRHKMFQFVLSLHQPWNQPFLQALGSFSRRWFFRNQDLVSGYTHC